VDGVGSLIVNGGDRVKPKIIKYETTEQNFYLFISHGEEAKTSCTYGLVSVDNKKMVEFSPEYGPFTLIESENVLEDYLDPKIKQGRGHWLQTAYDESGIKRYLSYGELRKVCNAIKVIYPELAEELTPRGEGKENKEE
jgi:hypothetical protein